MNIPPERYLSPKEIAAALSDMLGRKFSPKYVRAIRIETIRRGDSLFVAGVARVSSVVAWLQSNPSFTSNSVYAKNSRACSDAFPVSKRRD